MSAVRDLTSPKRSKSTSPKLRNGRLPRRNVRLQRRTPDRSGCWGETEDEQSAPASSEATPETLINLVQRRRRANTSESDRSVQRAEPKCSRALKIHYGRGAGLSTLYSSPLAPHSHNTHASPIACNIPAQLRQRRFLYHTYTAGRLLAEAGEGRSAMYI